MDRIHNENGCILAAFLFFTHLHLKFLYGARLFFPPKQKPKSRAPTNRGEAAGVIRYHTGHRVVGYKQSLYHTTVIYVELDARMLGLQSCGQL